MFACVNHNFSTVFHNGNLGGLASEAVARTRPVFHEELGEFFVSLRERRKQTEGEDVWTLRGAASIAQRRGLRSLSYQVLFRLEGGQIRHVSADVLRAAADLYGIAYEDVLSRYIASEYGLRVGVSDLSRHSSTKASALPIGGGDASAATTRERLQRLEQEKKDLAGEVAYYRAVVKQTRKAIARALAALGDEGREGSHAKRTRRRPA